MKIALLFLMAGIAEGAPCISATSACTEFITVAKGPARSMIYRTYSLDTKNSNITRALVVVHGTNRDADNYFRNALAATFLADALEDTVVIVPRIASGDGACHDTLAPNEVSYSCSGDSWRSGGFSSGGNSKLTSFDFMDDILRKLALKQAFPNLKGIVVAGHSAGGQFVTRYEMSNTVHESLAVPVTYVVANPSSYAYPDAIRPSGEGDKITFRNFRDGRNCTTYDDWPYGFKKRGGYASKLSDDQLKKQLISRPVTYILGEIDILPLGGFDSSCPAMAQGLTRRARGEEFVKMVNEKLGGHSKAVIIPECGHNARCMFTSEDALPLLFPKP